MLDNFLSTCMSNSLNTIPETKVETLSSDGFYKKYSDHDPKKYLVSRGCTTNHPRTSSHPQHSPHEKIRLS